ncbi:MAG: hypothetical protein ACYCW6_31540 [Candidatus Xenobia bacterium]
MFEKLRRQVKLAGELKTLVHTMKGMAAVGMRSAEQAVFAARAYQDVVYQGLGVILRTQGWRRRCDRRKADRRLWWGATLECAAPSIMWSVST